MVADISGNSTDGNPRERKCIIHRICNYTNRPQIFSFKWSMASDVVRLEREREKRERVILYKKATAKNLSARDNESFFYGIQ